MLVLKKDDVIRIITDQLTLQFKQKPIEVKVDLDWEKIKYDRSKKMFYYDTSNFWNNIIRYTYGSTNKFINSQRLKEYIIKEYPGLQSIKVEITAKDDEDLLQTASMEEIMELIDINVEVEHQDKVILGKNDYRDMIEIALLLKDKQWFEELVAEFNKVSIYRTTKY